jgi:hypothetical protein
MLHSQAATAGNHKLDVRVFTGDTRKGVDQQVGHLVVTSAGQEQNIAVR